MGWRGRNNNRSKRKSGGGVRVVRWRSGRGERRAGNNHARPRLERMEWYGTLNELEDIMLVCCDVVQHLCGATRRRGRRQNGSKGKKLKGQALNVTAFVGDRKSLRQK